MRLKIKGGKLLEDKKKVGVASITAQMMNESTSLKSSEEISVEMQKLGATIQFSSEDNETLVYFECLSDKLDESLKLFKEKLLNPGFNNDDFKRLKNTNLEGLESMKKNSQFLARSSFSNVLYGDTPFGREMNLSLIHI